MTVDATLEEEKHRMALALEAEKWVFKKEELIFVEAGQHIRALNAILWQVPSMAIAITGGLWYGVSLFDHGTVKIAALIFTSLVDIITVLIIWRLRSVMDEYIVTQRSFQPNVTQKRKKNRVIMYWTSILLLAAAMGFLGATNVKKLVRDSVNSKPTITSCETTLTLAIPSETPVMQPTTHFESTKNTLHKQCQ
jgi:hypothetical protein